MSTEQACLMFHSPDEAKLVAFVILTAIEVIQQANVVIFVLFIGYIK